MAKVDEAAAPKAATEHYKGEVEAIKRRLLSNGLAAYEVDVEVEDADGEFNVYVDAAAGAIMQVNIEYWEIRRPAAGRGCRLNAGPRTGRGIDLAAGPPTSQPSRLTVAAVATKRGAVDVTAPPECGPTRLGEPGNASGGMRTINALAQALVVSAALSIASVASAQPQPADWPCVQRLVPKLEAGQMWSGPPLEEVASASPELQQTARRLVDLKAAPEALQADVQAFAAQQPDGERARAMGQLFWLSLDWLNDERDVVIRGIKRFSAGQQALADRIVAETQALEQLQNASSGDASQLEQLQAARQWDTRIYTDRQKALTLVCDQPVELEQRAFALARIIQEHLP